MNKSELFFLIIKLFSYYIICEQALTIKDFFQNILFIKIAISDFLTINKEFFGKHLLI